MKLKQAFGEELRKLREEKGLSQEQLGFESGQFLLQSTANIDSVF